MISIPTDKQLHILGGAAVAGVFITWGPVAAIVAGAAAGIIKEVFDWALNKLAAMRGEPVAHTVDPYDFLATAGGGAAAVAVHQVVVAAAGVALPYITSLMA